MLHSCRSTLLILKYFLSDDVGRRHPPLALQMGRRNQKKRTRMMKSTRTSNLRMLMFCLVFITRSHFSFYIHRKKGGKKMTAKKEKEIIEISDDEVLLTPPKAKAKTASKVTPKYVSIFSFVFHTSSHFQQKGGWSCRAKDYVQRQIFVCVTVKEDISWHDPVSRQFSLLPSCP